VTQALPIWDVNEMIQAIVRGGRTVDATRLADPGVRAAEVLCFWLSPPRFWLSPPRDPGPITYRYN
jgi:hypothetical protein